MATEIDEDSARLLRVLAEFPRNDYVAASDIAKSSGLSPDRINDAMALLVNAGFVEWLQVMGTAPFDFGDAMITPGGRREVQKASALVPPSDPVVSTERQGVTAVH